MKSNDDAIYKVEIKRLALLTLPPWLRHPVAGALVYAGVAPLGLLLRELRELRDETSYRMGHNGQVCKLRGALNDMFDKERRGIRVIDGWDAESAGGMRVWQRSMERWVMVRHRVDGRCLTVNSRGYGGTGATDFVVAVPMRLRGVADEVVMRALVGSLKLAGKRYEITYVQ